MQDLLQCAVRIAEGSSGFGLEQRRWEALQQLRGAVKKRRGAAWRFLGKMVDGMVDLV